MTNLAMAELIDDANVQYGKLQEGLHITGYTFERACSHLEWLLERDRWKLAGRFEDPNAFLDSIRLDQFRAVAEQRKRIANRIKQLQPTASNRQIAKTLGAGRSTINRDVGPNGPTGPKNDRQNNDEWVEGGPFGPPYELSGTEAAMLAKRRAERKARDNEAEQRRSETSAESIDDPKIEIRQGDFRGVLTDLQNVDAIITDPPYGHEYLPLLHDLAVFAHRVLKPNGILAVLFGQTYLPEAFALMSGFRPYRWTACYLTEGNGYVSHARKVQSNWKPFLIYGGGEQRFADLLKSQGDSVGKDRHHWGQNFDAFKEIIERLTQPGDLVVDPFLGGGTTLLAARAAERRAIGCDLDPKAIETARAIINAEGAA